MVALMLGMVGCAPVPPSMTQEDIEVVNRAKTIRHYPVSRAKFIKTMGLTNVPSECGGGSIRGRTATYTETWKLPSGLLVSAMDWGYPVDWKITEISIDALLNKQIDGIPKATGNGRNGGDWLQPFPPNPPITSFKSCAITSSKGKVFFDSNDDFRTIPRANYERQGP